MAYVAEISDQSFEKEVINADLPVLVDFWAPWCGPCRALAPTLEEVAKENNGKIKILKISVDDNPKMAAQYNIRSIPALLLFNKGTMISSHLGTISKSKLITFLEEYL